MTKISESYASPMTTKMLFLLSQDGDLKLIKTPYVVMLKHIVAKFYTD
jgi:hypothetical protein